MALQGDLSSFALPDVLRLLAGTAKTGRLAVSGPTSEGEVWLRDGDLVGGSVATAPHADRPADVVFELLRFDGGSFVFDDGEQLVEAGERSTVDEAISAAEALVTEWTEVEAVVPSVHSWISLAPELTGKDVTIDADQWRTLAALGSGTTVRRLGDRFAQTDLAASRQVMDLVQAGLVELGDVIEPTPADADAPTASTSAADALAQDLALLTAEDGPVVLESREDALLPEPLPGAGTTFAGDLDSLGSVDGRSFEAMEADAEGFAPPAPVIETDRWNAHEAFAASLDQPAAIDPEEADDADPWADAPAAATTDFATEFAAAEAASSTEDDELPPLDEPVEDDRGSLLKFLSTVKP